MKIFLWVCGQVGSICRSIWQTKNSNKAHEMYSRNNLPQPRVGTRNQFGKYLSLQDAHIENACISATVEAHFQVQNTAMQQPGSSRSFCSVKGRLAGGFINSIKSGRSHFEEKVTAFSGLFFPHTSFSATVTHRHAVFLGGEGGCFFVSLCLKICTR